MRKVEEIRAESDEQLKLRLEELGKEIYQLRNEFARSRKLEKPHLLKGNKKERARILTILSERKTES